MNQASKEFQDRMAKVAELRKLGIKPYQDRVKQTHHAASLLQESDIPGVEDLKITTDIHIAGRLLLFREHGKLCFGKLRDESGEIQICFQKDVLEDKFNFAKKFLDLGDYIAVSGCLFKTHKGETTLMVVDFSLASKALRPLPEKWHGVTDTELQYRKRYLQTTTDRSAFDRFRIRTLTIQAIRNFLNKHSFMEVTTPTLANTASGALATPFVTYHNASSSNYYLRIAPETNLKKAVACGFERVYEFATNFRNEGLDPSHLPEFTMLEFYASYWNYEDLMNFTEEMIGTVLKEIYGSTKITNKDQEIDFTPPYRRVSIRDLVLEDCGIDIYEHKDAKSLLKAINSKKIQLKDAETLGLGNLIDTLYKKVSRPKIIQPIFLINHPKELSPLARQNDDNPLITDRFQLVVNTWEIINAYSELIDPIDQKERFMQQAEYKSQGDEEAMMLDYSFLEALEHGMPPMAGWGMGIERLLCLITDQENLRDVVLFPLTKATQEEQKLMAKLGQDANNQSTKDPLIEPGFTREQGVAQIEKYVDPKLQPHLYFVEAAMRGLAQHYGYEDQIDSWGLCGLMHDVDWSITEQETMNDNLLAHCGPTLDKIIGEIDGSPAFIEAIRSHYDEHGLPLDHMMKKALFAVDELCGFIVAVTLVRPSKQMADVKVKSVMKKLKDKSFAAAVDRKLIYTCEENLGVSIQEFVEMTLSYLKPIAGEFGM